MKKRKKVIGSDAKIYFNDEDLKADKRNNPRIFANSVSIDEGTNFNSKRCFYILSI